MAEKGLEVIVRGELIPVVEKGMGTELGSEETGVAASTPTESESSASKTRTSKSASRAGSGKSKD